MINYLLFGIYFDVVIDMREIPIYRFLYNIVKRI